MHHCPRNKPTNNKLKKKRKRKRLKIKNMVILKLIVTMRRKLIIIQLLKIKKLTKVPLTKLN
jgi:hypothetical protein